ncbi:hypothetical protein H4Q26_010926 [Puccinia striiformis f. sp. tritici PST-130]|nr:hypothetical protein H4Q26_010926 [Puccinia striiformis f. sp. tritici PST-130]
MLHTAHQHKDLAFPSHTFHDNLDLNGDGDSENPLSFAIVIPMFKTTGKMVLEAKGHRVNNGQFVLPDIKEAIVFAPDTICMMIFRAHKYAHGTLHATEVPPTIQGILLTPVALIDPLAATHV